MRSQQNHPQSLVALNAPILERRRLSDESCFATDAKLSRVIESFDDILAPARKQIASSVQRRKVNFDSQSAARVPFERMYTKPSLPEKKDLSCANASWSYARAWSIQYHDLMKRCLKLAKPMDPACRLSICIPVAATQEDKYIGKTIAAFSRQTASRESFELVLLVNAPIQDQKKNPAAIQATLENIDYAKRRYPDLRVVVVPLLIAPDVKVTIGLLRSIVTDLALLRHIRRKNGNDHILARADADTRGVGTGYIANFLYRFDRPPDDAHPYTAAYGGEILWSPERLINDVRFYLGAQLDHAFFIARRRDYGKMRIGGPNFAVRAMYYALTGGYDDTAELGEDVNFTRKLERTVREISPEVLPLAFAGSSARLYTSARRAEAAFRTNTLVIEQWNSSRNCVQA
jgi:hypothetical protein